MSKPYKVIIAIIELFFGIPVIGGAIILAHHWSPLLILFILHVIGLFLSAHEHKTKAGHIVGLVGNLLGWIPILGMLFHIATGLILLYQVIVDKVGNYN